MNTSASVASSTDVANGMRGITCCITRRIAPRVLAAAVAGTKPGQTELAVIGRGGSRR